MKVTNEEIQKDLFVQITNISDMRTEANMDIAVILKIIYSVQNIPRFTVLHQNLPERINYSMAILRGCDLEANREAIQAVSDSSAFKVKENDDEVALGGTLGYSIYRKLFNGDGKTKFEGYVK